MAGGNGGSGVWLLPRFWPLSGAQTSDPPVAHSTLWPST